MGENLLIFGINLLIPLTMVVFGLVLYKRPPKTVNGTFGYRTTRSMASQEAWDYAQRAFGRVWFASGAALTGVTVALTVAVNRPLYYIFIPQVVLLVAPIPFFERHLKKKLEQQRRIQ